MEHTSSLTDLAMNIEPQDQSQQQDEKDMPTWRKILKYVGPGFLVSTAYIDPGSLESDLQAGGSYKYELLWVMLVSSIFALVIQSRAANVGIATRKHLAEHFRAEYPRRLNFILWILAEVAVIAADIPEVLGSAFALNMLFRIPVWTGVLMTGVSTLLLIGIQKFGVRKLEAVVALLVFLMFASFFAELAYVNANAKEIVRGMFVPSLAGNGATAIAISIVGTTVVPHNLFLHSALVLSRKTAPTVSAINSACKYCLLESGVPLFIAFLINVAVIAVTASICSSPNLSAENANHCSNLDLNQASFLLRNVLGSWSSTVFAVALLASGQSSTITGTYAGQFVMQGFLEMKVKPWLRNMITRLIAIVPSLVVAVIFGSSGAGRLIIISSMILSFELPFALIPLLKFSSSKAKMGPHKSSILVTIMGWVIGACIVGVNIYYLSTQFVEWLIRNKLPKAANVVIGLLVFPILLLYVVGLLYLTFSRERVATYIAPGSDSAHAIPQRQPLSITA